MKRIDVLNEYKVSNDGIIQSPGKFEGEMLYLPHFYEAYLNGEADELDDELISVSVNDADRQEYPELNNQEIVMMRIRNDGFVCEKW